MQALLKGENFLIIWQFFFHFLLFWKHMQTSKCLSFDGNKENLSTIGALIQFQQLLISYLYLI